MKVLILTSTSARRRTPERSTVLRWVQLLRELGHHVRLGATPAAADVIILHNVKDVSLIEAEAGETPILKVPPRAANERPAGQRAAWAHALAEVTAPAARLRLLGPGLSEEAARRDLATDVRAGLTARPKQLSCRFFYDEEGSILFETICALPEYYIPAAEAEILRAHATELAESVPANVIVELGSGNGDKTRILLEAFLDRRKHVRYVPIDVSRTMLEESALEILAGFPRLDVVGLAAEYEEGLARLDEVARAPRLFLWLGSNVGNFDRAGAAAFLGRVRARLTGGDRLLVGFDLRKPAMALELAYDDPRGVTARFNKNLLARINRELGGEFDLAAFDHQVVVDEEIGRVRTYLVARKAHKVTVRALDLEVKFTAGEAVHTEDSYKYSAGEIDALASAAGLKLVSRWQDRAGWFCDVLFAPA